MRLRYVKAVHEGSETYRITGGLSVSLGGCLDVSLAEGRRILADHPSCFMDVAAVVSAPPAHRAMPAPSLGCPTCGARGNDPCLTSSGNHRKSKHAARG